MQELLSYLEVADRVEQSLGVRPALSTLRAAAAAGRRASARTRLTEGMPAPVAGTDSAGRTLFSAVEVDVWLAEHPRRRLHREQQQLAAAPTTSRQQAVTDARRAGLSWQQIADAFAGADGTTYTRQAAQQRYGGS